MEVEEDSRARRVDWDVRRLRCFVAVAEELHFGRAAERMGITRSALTQQVQRLEREVGVELLHRTSRRVALSQAGRDFLPIARQVVLANDRLSARLNDGDHDPPAFRVGFTETAPGPLMRPILSHLQSFLDGRPEVVLRRVAEHGVVDALLSRRVDAAYAREPVTHAGVRVTRLFDEPMVAVLARPHALAAREVLRVEDLAGETLVALSAHVEAFDAFWAGRPKTEAVGARMGQRVSSFDELRQLCAAGLGIGLAPASVAGLYAHPQLAFVRVADLAPSSVALCVRDDDEQPTIGVLGHVTARVVTARRVELERRRVLAPSEDGRLEPFARGRFDRRRQVQPRVA